MKINKTTIIQINLIIFVTMTIYSCNSPDKSDAVAKAKQAILNTEKEFEAYVKKEGIAAAFTKFADEDAVINRKNEVLKGKKAIKEFYESQKADKDQITWNASFVDVSSSCDLGYTYGNYIYTAMDSSGTGKEYKGIFHTVWKKQQDDTWKCVWD